MADKMNLNSNRGGEKKGALWEALNQVKNNLNTSHSLKDDIRSPSPSPMCWREDGEDHINIGEYAKTPLGQALSPTAPLEFNHPLYGSFRTMEAFWYYIQSNEMDDRIRNLTGYKLKQFRESLKSRKVPNFKAVIMYGHYCKIKAYQPLIDEMIASTLPFECYYIKQGTDMRERPAYFKWFIIGFSEIRSALKEGREPNFNFLMDVNGSDIHQFVIPAKNEVKEAPKKELVLQPAEATELTQLLQTSNEEEKHDEIMVD